MHLMIENPEGFYEADQSHYLGKLFFDNLGRIWRYVKNASATAAAKGAPAYETATAWNLKKNANKIALDDLGGGIAGAWAAAVPAGYFGFVGVNGVFDFLLGDTGTAAGEAVTGIGGDIWATATIGTHHVLGFAYTDDTTSVFTGRLACL